MFPGRPCGTAVVSGGGAHRLRRRIGRERPPVPLLVDRFPGAARGRRARAQRQHSVAAHPRRCGPVARRHAPTGPSAQCGQGGRRGIRPAAFRSRGGGMSWPWPWPWRWPAREARWRAGRSAAVWRAEAARGVPCGPGPFAGRGNVRACGRAGARPVGRGRPRAGLCCVRTASPRVTTRDRGRAGGGYRCAALCGRSGGTSAGCGGPATAGEGADGARCRGAAVRPISGVAVLVLPSWMPVPAVVPSGTWRARTRSAGAAARRRRRIPRAPTEALMAPVVSSLSLSVVPSSVSGVRAGRITAVERLFLHVGAARKRLRTATVARAFGQVGRRLSGSKQGA